jgi:hypothetical protein
VLPFWTFYSIPETQKLKGGFIMSKSFFSYMITLSTVLFMFVLATSSIAGEVQKDPIWSIFKDGQKKSVKWVNAENPRFAIYKNETPGLLTDDIVLDRETGLVWERSPETDRDIWVYGVQYCHQKELGGRKGWRTPTVEELSSLIDSSQFDPSLPSGHPFINVQTKREIFDDIELDYYWTMTTDVGNDENAWYVGFYEGAVGADIKGYNDRFSWCVRGGYGYDGY